MSNLNEICSECKETLPLKVLKSASGYYLGYFCPNCGPYGRISSYYTKEQAEYLLDRILEEEKNDNRTDKV